MEELSNNERLEDHLEEPTLPLEVSTPNGSVDAEVPLEDPLEITQLSLSYDYLLYKIKDHISSLSEATYNAVLNKQNLSQEYLQDQLHIEREIDLINKSIQITNELELSFMKFAQLQMFIEDFKIRLDRLERKRG